MARDGCDAVMLCAWSREDPENGDDVAALHATAALVRYMRDTTLSPMLEREGGSVAR